MLLAPTQHLRHAIILELDKVGAERLPGPSETGHALQIPWLTLRSAQQGDETVKRRRLKNVAGPDSMLVPAYGRSTAAWRGEQRAQPQSRPLASLTCAASSRTACTPAPHLPVFLPHPLSLSQARAFSLFPCHAVSVSPFPCASLRRPPPLLRSVSRALALAFSASLALVPLPLAAA